MIPTIFALLVAFQVKHFLADFPLQSPYMLGKFKEKGWILPLAAHAGVHAAMTDIIALLAGASLSLALGLAAFDFVCHFVMDRVKASPRLMGRWKNLSADEYRSTVRSLEAFSDASHPEILSALRLYRDRLRGNRRFWIALGIDQGVHHLTHYVIIAALVLL